MIDRKQTWWYSVEVMEVSVPSVNGQARVSLSLAKWISPRQRVVAIADGAPKARWDYAHIHSTGSNICYGQEVEVGQLLPVYKVTQWNWFAGLNKMSNNLSHI